MLKCYCLPGIHDLIYSSQFCKEHTNVFFLCVWKPKLRETHTHRKWQCWASKSAFFPHHPMPWPCSQREPQKMHTSVMQKRIHTFIFAHASANMHTQPSPPPPQSGGPALNIKYSLWVRYYRFKRIPFPAWTVLRAFKRFLIPLNNSGLPCRYFFFGCPLGKEEPLMFNFTKSALKSRFRFHTVSAG